jgi:hypothetical protein
VEKENILAKQDGASSRAALEQERKKVSYSAGEEITCSGCCVQKSPSNSMQSTPSHPVALGFFLYSLGLPRSFPSSTYFSNMLHVWSTFSPFIQWPLECWAEGTNCKYPSCPALKHPQSVFFPSLLFSFFILSL